MDADFWHNRWATNDIGFHQSEANPLLVKYFEKLRLTKNARIFVPLCGKTLDIGWLLACSFRVVGVEFSRTAVKELFTELELEPSIAQVRELTSYSAKDIEVFVGDIFSLSKETLGQVDAIYDRAALVALPETMRVTYTTHLREITADAPQLLITFEYDQNMLEGPPFSVSRTEVEQHYRDSYKLTLLASEEVVGGFKGEFPATKNAWLMLGHCSAKSGAA